jgi:hypothetical protein
VSEKRFLPALVLVAGNNSSRASTWLNVEFPVKMVSYAPLDAEETGVVGMMLWGLGFDNTTSLYVVSGKIYHSKNIWLPSFNEKR